MGLTVESVCNFFTPICLNVCFLHVSNRLRVLMAKAEFFCGGGEFSSLTIKNEKSEKAACYQLI